MLLTTKNVLPPSHTGHTRNLVLGLLFSKPVFLLLSCALRTSHFQYHRDHVWEAESWGSGSECFLGTPLPSLPMEPQDPDSPGSGSAARPHCLPLQVVWRGEGAGSTWKGFSPVWTSWCRFSFELSTNALPHSAQTWTLGPWVCRCFLMAELSLNIFVQPFKQREKLSGSHCKLVQRIQPLNSLHWHIITTPTPHFNLT